MEAESRFPPAGLFVFSKHFDFGVVVNEALHAFGG